MNESPGSCPTSLATLVSESFRAQGCYPQPCQGSRGPVGPTSVSRDRNPPHGEPPAQIPACGITAPGSCLGSNAKPLERIRMYDMGHWQPLGHQTVHSFPRQRFLLSTAFQYTMPQFRYLVSNSSQCFRVPRHSEIECVSFDDSPQPRALCRYGLVSLAPERLFDSLEQAPHSFGIRLASYHELPFPVSPTCVSKSQKLKRLRWFLLPPLSSLLSIPAKFQQPRLFGVQRQLNSPNRSLSSHLNRFASGPFRIPR